MEDFVLSKIALSICLEVSSSSCIAFISVSWRLSFVMGELIGYLPINITRTDFCSVIRPDAKSRKSYRTTIQPAITAKAELLFCVCSHLLKRSSILLFPLRHFFLIVPYLVFPRDRLRRFQKGNGP